MFQTVIAGPAATGVVQIHTGGKPLSQKANDLKCNSIGKAQKSVVATENITMLLLTKCHERLQLETNQGQKITQKKNTEGRSAEMGMETEGQI